MNRKNFFKSLLLTALSAPIIIREALSDSIKFKFVAELVIAIRPTEDWETIIFYRNTPWYYES